MKTIPAKIKNLPVFAVIDDAEDSYSEDPRWFEWLSGNLLLDTGAADGMWNAGEHEIEFFCGPEDRDGTLSDALSCDEWMETKGLHTIVAKYGASLDIGAGESLHIIAKKSKKSPGFTQAELDDLWAELRTALTL